MRKRILKGKLARAGILMLAVLTWAFAAVSHETGEERYFVQIDAKTKEQRSEAANAGISIEWTRSDSAWGFATQSSLDELKSSGIKVLQKFKAEIGKDGHHMGPKDFPVGDARFHNYEEMKAKIESLGAAHADIARTQVVGKSLEGRDLIAIHINTSTEALESGQSSKPGVIFMGTHHAREHLSTEVPLMLAEHLLNNKNQVQLREVLENRDIWIIPMVNPDGVEWDINTGRYKMWRKNRRANKDGTWGVDLNRNYGYMWGTGGSSNNGSSDIYMGPEPFSEPETQAMKAFVDAHLNTTVLISVHTFSELILYPWGHKYDGINNERDLAVFEKMARTMAQWNKYTPQQASDLYIASGDTTDWAYGQHGIFAFTFELSPKSMWDGGFYPGAGVIDRVFQANLQPFLYAIDVADDPYKVIGTAPTGFLKSYVEPQVPHELLWKKHPF